MVLVDGSRKRAEEHHADAFLGEEVPLIAIVFPGVGSTAMTRSLLTLTLLATMLACDPNSPTAFDEPRGEKSQYEQVREIMGAQFARSEITTVIERLNIALGNPADDPMRLLISHRRTLNSGIRYTILEDGIHREASVEDLAMIVAASFANQEVCRFNNGGTTQQFQEYLDCAEEAMQDDDCGEVVEMTEFVDSNGDTRVAISALTVVCEESLSSG